MSISKHEKSGHTSRRVVPWRENKREILCANEIGFHFFFFSINGIARSPLPTPHSTFVLHPLKTTSINEEVHHEQKLLCGLRRCNYRAPRKAIRNRHPFCIARESPLQKGALPNGGSSSFQTVTHFATGKHLSDALLPPPPPLPSPERKNGNTLIQSGVTKRPAFS